jgi:hypothetical protein
MEEWRKLHNEELRDLFSELLKYRTELNWTTERKALNGNLGRG